MHRSAASSNTTVSFGCLTKALPFQVIAAVQNKITALCDMAPIRSDISKDAAVSFCGIPH